MKRVTLAIGLSLAIALAALAGTGTLLDAQNRMDFSIVSAQSGHVALGLALRKLDVSGTFMQCPAHPDDETNQLLAYMNYGVGVRTIDLQNNRGEGGQNEIGPELFHDMGVLRTSELLSAHRLDGAEQYFTRAIDYGYSFDPQEVINKWGEDAIVGDYVRLFRTLRPDVIVTMNIQGSGGDRAHEATTVLVREAFRASGDATRYPEQLREGLRVWQPKKLYFAGGGGGGGGGRGRGGPAGPGGAPGAPAGGRAGGAGAAGGGGGRGAGGARGGAAAAAGPGGAPQAARGGAAGGAAQRVARVDTSGFDPLLGRSYTDIGSDARSSHKCQGIGGGPLLIAGGGRGGPGGGGPGGGGGLAYTLMDSTIPGQMEKDETSLFDGVDITLPGLANYAGVTPPPALSSALTAIADDAHRANEAFGAGSDAATVAPLEAGLTAVRGLETAVGSLPIDDNAKYEIDFRLKQTETDFTTAVLAAHDLAFQAIADDGLVIAGQPVRLSLAIANHGTTPVVVSAVEIKGLDNPAACAAGSAAANGIFSCTAAAAIPKNAEPTQPYFTDQYWSHPSNPARNDFAAGVPFGVPFAPTPFRVEYHLTFGNLEIVKDVPVEYAYVKDLYFGEKRMELNVVPAFSATMTPTLAVVPAAARGGVANKREIVVSVINGTKGAAQASVSLQLPTGWTATPASTPLAFDKEDEGRTARFVVTVPAAEKTGAFPVTAVVSSPALTGQSFSTGYQEIDYPHIQRRQVIKAAQTTFKVIDVKTAANTNVGYIMGVGDQVPPAIEQLGAKLTLIDEKELAWGDLSKYQVIITGVRAYERRADLRAYNSRLLDYAQRGGTVIVQYNKMEFNQAQYGPFPAQVSDGRVSDENVPVNVLVPTHPVFNTPNKIGPSAWANWTQERGLYFLGQKDPKYVDLISMTDSFPDNPGEKRGALVEARPGKGRWIYLGLGLWRQLPAGTDGAYQLLANLLALRNTTAPAAAPATAAAPAK